MDVSDVRAYLDRECTFPVDHDALVERVGDVELDGSTADPETIGTVLDRTGETSYRSAEAAAATVRASVCDAYIGRKYYDDRAGARAIPRADLPA